MRFWVFVFDNLWNQIFVTLFAFDRYIWGIWKIFSNSISHLSFPMCFSLSTMYIGNYIYIYRQKSYNCTQNIAYVLFQLYFAWQSTPATYDDVIKWKHFPHYWPFVWGINRSQVNSPLKGQWRRAFMFSLICAWINGWVNSREAGDLRHHCSHYDVIVKSTPLHIRFEFRVLPVSHSMGLAPVTLPKQCCLHYLKWKKRLKTGMCSLWKSRKCAPVKVLNSFGQYLRICLRSSI